MAKGDKLTPKQERFCLNLFQGMSQRVAYIDAGYSSKQGMNVIDRNACVLAKSKKILIRIDELKKIAEENSVATVLERKQILTKIVRADLAKPDTTIASKLTIEAKEEGEQVVTKIEYPDKIKAISELNKMEGIYSDTTNIQNNILVVNGKPIQELSDEELMQIAMRKQIEEGR